MPWSIARLRGISLSHRLRTRTVTVAAFALWIPAVGWGLQTLFRYSFTPGHSASPPRDWPGSSELQLAANQSTLLIFAHPQCPCSEATVGELAQIVARCPRKLSAYVLFYAPESMGAEWVRGKLWTEAAAIPGVRVIADHNGRETRRFGAATSGQALLYDPAGRLVFYGGITAARGHFGPNDGVDSVISLLDHGSSKLHSAPVFGCSLLGGA